MRADSGTTKSDPPLSRGRKISTTLASKLNEATSAPEFSGPKADAAASASIARSCRAPLGHMPAIFPAPGGGMTLARVEEIHAFYGPDTALLVGGDLHRGDLLANVTRMRAAVDDDAGEPRPSASGVPGRP